jgi:hypothetical protein
MNRLLIEERLVVEMASLSTLSAVMLLQSTSVPSRPIHDS